ncbi:ComF family protein [Lactobacillus sp. PV034]|uniref:ComF family protein n=1 Tax=Lactobacillus sp. PV034 TaxID=2594495 RepID=UPI0022409AEB|nr:ComF family protein [Lactobacillus sp. PV034]QNQ80726.1 ComF family protein [Lactobacillus sp. PV034]
MNECLMCFTRFAAQLNYRELFLFRKNTPQYICSNCKNKFHKLTKDGCQNCSKSLIKAEKICKDCHYWQKCYQGKIIKNISLYRYNAAFHDLMVQYKRYGDYEMRRVLQALIYKIPKADLYVPLPSSPSHLKIRGYDTITSIYCELVELTNLLEKSDHEAPQGEKNKRERLETKQTFSVKEDYFFKRKPQKILLLDDIYTTGRTIYHARDAILKAFPSCDIQSFTIAR